MHNFKLHYFSHGLRREVDELFASVAISDFAIAMVLLFEPIYFVTVLGWDLARVFLFFAGVYALYILFIPIGAKISAKFGYEHGMLYSIPFQIGYWLLLFNSANHPSLVFWAILSLAIEKSLFWPAFHSDLARYSDKDQRSREFSLVFALAHIVLVIGPFVGGIISQKFGVGALLIVSSLVYFTMFIPLFTTLERTQSRSYYFRDTLNLYKKDPKEALGHIGYGEELIFLVAWPIFIFTVIPNFFQLGSVIALSTLVATALVLYVGKISDEGKRPKVLRIAVWVAVGSWILRLFTNNLSGVLATDTISRLGRDSGAVSITSRVYDRANEEKILPYIVFFEQALSIGKLAAALIGFALYSLTQSFIPIFFLAAAFTLLYLLLPFKKT